MCSIPDVVDVLRAVGGTPGQAAKATNSKKRPREAVAAPAPAAAPAAAGMTITLCVDFWSPKQLKLSREYGRSAEATWIRLQVSHKATVLAIVRKLCSVWRFSADHRYTFTMNGNHLQSYAGNVKGVVTLASFHPCRGNTFEFTYDDWTWTGRIISVAAGAPAEDISVVDKQGRPPREYPEFNSDGEEVEDNGDEDGGELDLDAGLEEFGDEFAVHDWPEKVSKVGKYDSDDY